jgi:hypothetical protein
MPSAAEVFTNQVSFVKSAFADLTNQVLFVKSATAALTNKTAAGRPRPMTPFSGRAATNPQLRILTISPSETSSSTIYTLNNSELIKYLFF